MKILFVVPRFHTNHIGWIKALKIAKFEVTVFSLLKYPQENHQFCEPKILKISYISKLIIKIFGEGGENLYRGFPNFLFYFKKINKLKPDYIIVRDFGRWFSLLTIIIAKILNLKIIFYSQSNFSTNINFFKKIKYWFFIKFFNAKIMTPLLTKNSNFFHPHIFYVPFCVDIADKIRITNNNIRLLTVGKFENRKNIDLLIDVYREIIIRNPNIELTIIGQIINKKHELLYQNILKKINIYHLNKKIKIMINKDYTDMSNIYYNADIFVLPSTQEPASISVIEAMGQGIPVIASSTCGTSCFIKDNFNGLIFKDNNYDSLLNSIIMLCKDIKSINNIKLNTLKEAKDNFSQDVFLNIFKSKIIN